MFEPRGTRLSRLPTRGLRHRRPRDRRALHPRGHGQRHPRLHGTGAVLDGRARAPRTICTRPGVVAMVALNGPIKLHDGSFRPEELNQYLHGSHPEALRRDPSPGRGAARGPLPGRRHGATRSAEGAAGLPADPCRAVPRSISRTPWTRCRPTLPVPSARSARHPSLPAPRWRRSGPDGSSRASPPAPPPRRPARNGRQQTSPGQDAPTPQGVPSPQSRAVQPASRDRTRTSTGATGRTAQPGAAP